MADTAPDFGNGPAPKRHPNTAPKAAASLVIADVTGTSPRFLMGRRSDAHVFMPGFFVFPGGRLERSDYRNNTKLFETDSARIGKPNLGSALIGCAIRETLEETGFDISVHASPIRYLGRAITPPRQARRFDTRFFLTIADRTAFKRQSAPDNELLTVDWFEPTAIPSERLHRITGLILQAALQRLKDDPALTRDVKTPTHRFRYGKAMVEYE